MDIFAGTGIIASKAARYYKNIIINDFLYSNNVIYKAFFNLEDWDKKKLSIITQQYNNLCSANIDDNYFSFNYGGKFFSKNDAKIIGKIRENLASRNDINEKEYNVLLASLLYSVDKIANTVGHYDAYFKNRKLKSRFNFKLIKPTEIKNVQIYREDANELALKISADIVYVDPPYNSRQYSRFYHVLENLIKWDKPKLEGVALKPPAENMSEYCRSKAPQALEQLVNNLNCKFIVLSYNNTYSSKSSSSKNKITLEQIQDILSKKGKTKIYECNHKHFNSGKTSFNDHKEFVFVTGVS